MSITKSGIKSFSLYKDCPTPYDYLTCLQLSTLPSWAYHVLQGVGKSLSGDCSNSSKCAHIQKMTNDIITLTRDTRPLMHTCPTYIVFGVQAKICYYAFGVSFTISQHFPMMLLYKEIRADSVAYSITTKTECGCMLISEICFCICLTIF